MLEKALTDIRAFLSGPSIRDLLVAREGLKVSRIGLPYTNLPQFLDVAAALGVAVSVRPDAIYLKRDRGKGGWSNMVGDRHRGERHCFVYVGKDRVYADAAAAADALDDDDALGELLSIPACCREFYAQHASIAAEQQNDFLPFFATNVAVRVPAALNLGGQYFGASLISHFPCSPHCTQSLEMAGRQAEVMRCYEPDWLRKTIHVLNKVTIYTEYQGIFLLEPKEREPDGTIAYCNTDVMGTAKSRLGCALPQGNRIAITPDGRLGIRSGETGSVVLRAKNLRVLDPWPMSG